MVEKAFNDCIRHQGLYPFLPEYHEQDTVRGKNSQYQEAV
jgi:hypothetical protein